MCCHYQQQSWTYFKASSWVGNQPLLHPVRRVGTSLKDLSKPVEQLPFLNILHACFQMRTHICPWLCITMWALWMPLASNLYNHLVQTTMHQKYEIVCPSPITTANKPHMNFTNGSGRMRTLDLEHGTRVWLTL